MGIYSELSATFSQEVADRLPGDSPSTKKQSFSTLLDSMSGDLPTVQLKCHKRSVQVVGDWDSVFMIHEVLQSWMALQTDIKLEVDHSGGEMDTNHEDCQIINPSETLARNDNTGDRPPDEEGSLESLLVGAEEGVPVFYKTDPDTQSDDDNIGGLESTNLLPEQTIRDKSCGFSKRNKAEQNHHQPEASHSEINKDCEPDNRDRDDNSGDDVEENADSKIEEEASKKECYANELSGSNDMIDTNARRVKRPSSKGNSVEWDNACMVSVKGNDKQKKCDPESTEIECDINDDHHLGKKYLPPSDSSASVKSVEDSKMFEVETKDLSPDTSNSDCITKCVPDPVDDDKSTDDLTDADGEGMDDSDYIPEEELSSTDSDTDSEMVAGKVSVEGGSDPCNSSVLRKSNVNRKCKFCGKRFSSKVQCRNHETEKHLSQYIARLQSRMSVKPPSNKQYCPECYMLVDSFEILVQHFQAAHCNESLLAQNAQLTEEKSFHCSMCNHSTDTRMLLKEHCQRLHWAKQFECSYCGKLFGTLRYMNQHIRNSHTEILACHICGVLNKGKHNLKNHIQGVHEGRRTKQARGKQLCGLCGKVFVSKPELQDHINKHNNVKAHKCGTCGKDFYSRHCLMTHVRKIHKARQGQFPCDSCEKTFPLQHQLKAHRKIVHCSENYKCKECGKAFKVKMSLERHERIHTGIKPYPCRLCGKAFNDSSILRRHLLGVHKSDDRSLLKKADLSEMTSAIV